jgi:SAM-dependent methyltransferase
MPSFGQIFPPNKFRHALKLLKDVRRPRILDIGCGNKSPSITKHWFSESEYHGVDIVEDYNLSAEDKKAMDRFIKVTIEGGGYDQIPDESYDLLIMSHVIEHMNDPLPTLQMLLRKVRSGGMIYLAFPSERTLGLPSAVDTLHFSDDSTHIFLPSVRDCVNLMLANRFRIVFGGTSRNPARWVLGCCLAPIRFLTRLLTGNMSARGLWYFYGFESSVVAVKL